MEMALWTKILGSYKITTVLWIFLATALLIRALLLRFKNMKIYKFMASTPGPISIPFLGNAYFLLEITSENLYPKIKKVLLQYPSAGYWVGSDPWLITDDLKVFNALLGSNQNITKTDSYQFFNSHANGIFCVNGDTWRKIRKIINPSFRTNVLASFGDSFSYHTNVFIDNLANHADDGKYVDLFVPVHLCTIDFICENMMGCRMDVQNQKLAHLSLNLEKSTKMIYARMFNMLLQSDLLYSLQGKQRELNELVKDMRIMAREMVEMRMKYREELRSLGKSTETVLIFMECLLNNIESGVFTKDRAVDETVEMFIAGSITTATTSAWVLKIFALIPEIQEKVYQEITELFPGKQEITLDDISKLEYLDMVVKETLRHFAVPFVGRHLVEDLKVDEKTTIPAGIRILPLIFALHHNPEHWEKANEFYPEHFSPANERKRAKGTFVPFLSGPRHCPGNKYALQSIKYLVSNTLLHYTFSTEEKPPEDFFNAEYRILFMLWPVSGFKAKISRRSGKTQSTTSDVLEVTKPATLNH